MLLLLLIIFIPIIHAVDLASLLSEAVSPPPPDVPLIRIISYDLQIQLPLSEVHDPDTPLFTGRTVIQLEIKKDIIPIYPYITENDRKTANFTLLISGLDHFENVSLVHNGREIGIVNVVLTDDIMEVFVDQPILKKGRYTLSIHRYKGVVGNAIFYRDAGEHAVFGSALYPHRASAIFPTINSITTKVPISVGIVHPLGSRAISSSSQDGNTQIIDENWQMTQFHQTASIPPALIAISLLPIEYHHVSNNYTSINIAVHYNKLRIQEAQAKHILDTATQVTTILKQMLISPPAVAKLDLILINDVSASPAVGVVIIPESAFLLADYANQAYLLSTWIIRQWIGGVITIRKEADLCLQEDLISFIAFKVVKRMTNDENIRLAHYSKIMISESLFEPGLNLILPPGADDKQIENKCGLKGVIMLESIEDLMGEHQLLAKINSLILDSPYGYFDTSSFMTQIQKNIDDNVNLAQVFSFWRGHGGIPYLKVDRWETSVRLSQVAGNRTVQSESGDWERMPLWPLVMEFSEFKLPVHLMLSQGIHLAPVRPSLSLANLGFSHLHRVNYDVSSWQSIINALSHNSTSYTKRERAQLIGDFCHFYAINEIMEPGATLLRDTVIGMIKRQSLSFPLCEMHAYPCIAAKYKEHAIGAEKTAQIRKRLFDSLSSSSDHSCGRGAVHDIMQELCQHKYGTSCL